MRDTRTIGVRPIAAVPSVLNTFGVNTPSSMVAKSA